MSRPPWKLFVAVGCVCALLAGSAAASAPKLARFGAAPSHPSGSSVVGALSTATAMHLTVTLKPRDPAALTGYATDVATPGSSVYHHYLTVAEFRQRFGPTDATIAAVETALRTHGLSPGAVTANGLSIPVNATTAAVGHALSTSFQRVRLATGRVAFANTSAPLLNASVAGDVQAVLGLQSLVVPHPIGLHTSALHPGARGTVHDTKHPHTDGPQPCATATAAAESQGTYTTDQIASAYEFPNYYAAGDEGAGQRVAIFELENNFPTDITGFESCYGITTGNVSYHKVDGGPGGPPSVTNGDGIETELDIENVVGIAPKANVVVYQGPYFSTATDAEADDVYSAMITSNATILTTSWGECESQEGLTGPDEADSEEALFEEAAAQGQSVFAAAGDDGSEDCTDDSGNPVGELAVDDPGTDPYVTSSGGTSMSKLGPPPTESVWNDTCYDPTAAPCGGGGGVSTFWPMRSWQADAPKSLNVINSDSSGTQCSAPSGSYCREVPDISADADPSTGYTIYYDGDGTGTDEANWIQVGGTSAVGPLWAGYTALINDSSECTSNVGYMNPNLYDAAGRAYQLDFHDVTKGDNFLSLPNFSTDLYPAGPGYDMASGLGTPVGPLLGANLCDQAVTITNPGARTAVINVPFKLQIAITDSQNRSLERAVSGLPPGLSMNASDLISGTPTTIGTYQVTVAALDSHYSNADEVFDLTVDPVTVTLKNPGNRSNRATSSVRRRINASDNNGGALSYSASGLPKGLSIKKTTGVISGSPTTGGKHSVKVTAKDGSASASVKFKWTITGPYASQASLGGIAGGRPKLALTIKRGLRSAAIKQLLVGLPRGLNFSGRLSGIKVVGSNGKQPKGYTLAIVRHRLQIELKRSLKQVGIVITVPADSATQSLTTSVKHERLKQLGVTIRVTGSTGRVSTLDLHLKPS